MAISDSERATTITSADKIVWTSVPEKDDRQLQRTINESQTKTGWINKATKAMLTHAKRMESYRIGLADRLTQAAGCAAGSRKRLLTLRALETIEANTKAAEEVLRELQEQLLEADRQEEEAKKCRAGSTRRVDLYKLGKVPVKYLQLLGLGNDSTAYDKAIQLTRCQIRRLIAYRTLTDSINRCLSEKGYSCGYAGCPICWHKAALRVLKRIDMGWFSSTIFCSSTFVTLNRGYTIAEATAAKSKLHGRVHRAHTASRPDQGFYLLAPQRDGVRGLELTRLSLTKLAGGAKWSEAEHADAATVAADLLRYDTKRMESASNREELFEFFSLPVIVREFGNNGNKAAGDKVKRKRQR